MKISVISYFEKKPVFLVDNKTIVDGNSILVLTRNKDVHVDNEFDARFISKFVETTVNIISDSDVLTTLDELEDIRDSINDYFDGDGKPNYDTKDISIVAVVNYFQDVYLRIDNLCEYKYILSNYKLSLKKVVVIDYSNKAHRKLFNSRLLDFIRSHGIPLTLDVCDVNCIYNRVIHRLSMERDINVIARYIFKSLFHFKEEFITCNTTSIEKDLGNIYGSNLYINKIKRSTTGVYDFDIKLYRVLDACGERFTILGRQLYVSSGVVPHSLENKIVLKEESLTGAYSIIFLYKGVDYIQQLEYSISNDGAIQIADVTKDIRYSCLSSVPYNDLLSAQALDVPGEYVISSNGLRQESLFDVFCFVR